MSKHGLHPRRVVRRDGVTQRYWVRPDPNYDRAIMSWAQQMFAPQSRKQQQGLQQAGFTDEQIDQFFQSPTFTNAILRSIDREGYTIKNFRFIISLRPYIGGGYPVVEQFLVRLATECANKDVREGTMDILGQLAPPSAPRLFREIADNSPDEWGKRMAITHLSKAIREFIKSEFKTDSQKQAFREALDTIADAMLERWFPYDTMDDYPWVSRSISAVTIDEQYFDELTGGPSPDVDALKRKLLDGMAHVMSVPDLDHYIFSRGLAILGSWMPGYALQKLREVEARMQDPQYLASTDDAEFQLRRVRETIQVVQERIERGDGA